MRLEAPPFLLGEYHTGTDADGNLINDHLLGATFVFDFKNPGTVTLRGNKTLFTNAPIHAVVLRNTYTQASAATALLPKRLVRRNITAGYKFTKEANAYGTTLADTRVVLVDPYLPAAGVPANALFWGIMGGIVTMLTPTIGADFNDDIVAGAITGLVAATAAGSTTTAAGRVANPVLANATDAAGAATMARGFLGWAMSSRTTGETNSDVLVFMAQGKGR
jgi:hypothetical protein